MKPAEMHLSFNDYNSFFASLTKVCLAFISVYCIAD